MLSTRSSRFLVIRLFAVAILLTNSIVLTVLAIDCGIGPCQTGGSPPADECHISECYGGILAKPIPAPPPDDVPGTGGFMIHPDGGRACEGNGGLQPMRGGFMRRTQAGGWMHGIALWFRKTSLGRRGSHSWRWWPKTSNMLRIRLWHANRSQTARPREWRQATDPVQRCRWLRESTW